MKRGRLTAIAGSLGLLAWLASSGVAAQADTSTSDATFNTMVNSYVAVANSGRNFCYAQPASTTSCPPTITQTSTQVDNRDNVAVCVEYMNVEPSAEQCSIDQTNVDRNNIAIVIQIVNQKSGPTQDATQDAAITQNNMKGNNFAAVVQLVKQSTNAAADQTQTDGQFARIDQNPTTLLAATGRNLAILGESSKQYAESETDPASSQNQTSNQDVNSFDHHINQHSQGVSRAFANQEQTQRLEGSGPQTQVVDPRCCSLQEINPASRFNILQIVSQMGNDTAVQHAVTLGECETSGNCMVTQSTQENRASATNSCSGKACHVFISCTSTAAAGSCTAPPNCLGTECPQPPCLIGCNTRPTASIGPPALSRVRAILALAKQLTRIAPRPVLIT